MNTLSPLCRRCSGQWTHQTRCSDCRNQAVKQL